MRSIAETDLGTPKSTAAEQVALTIDGRQVTVPAGTSVLRAAAEIGIGIPKLCATELLDAFGSCRLCLVQIEGMKGYPASCTTPVAAGMKVSTQTAKLGELRRGVMELYMSVHPLGALTSPPGGHTDIEDMAREIGLADVRYGFDNANHVEAEKADGSANPLFTGIDGSNPYFNFDPAQCIVCSRCVRACDEQQGTFALTIQGRGFASKLGVMSLLIAAIVGASSFCSAGDMAATLSRRKFLVLLSVSSKTMPRNTARSPYSFETASSTGCSYLQGPHQVAQKLSTTGLPLKSLNETT